MENKVETLRFKLFNIGCLLQPLIRTRKFSVVTKESSVVAGPFKFTDGVFKILYDNKQQVGTDQPLVYVKKTIDGEDRLIRSVRPMRPDATGLKRSSLVEYSPRGPRMGGQPARMTDLVMRECILNPNAEIYLVFEFDKNPQN